ncbi:hypothetical protein LCGC14_1215640 [marine sediment metagenome]|uniref:Uncharacterized protein n=2 Tax=root TaxID=1 RepID=A0A831VQP9_9FLAO|nr:hypothetical protein [Pricia antarctica]
MTVNEKLIQFVEYLGTSQRKFTKACDLSEGALRGKNSIGADKLGRIKRIHPELNLEWVISDDDEGEMTLPAERINPELKESGVKYQIQGSIDKIVERKIANRFDELKGTLAELVANEIEKELERAKKMKPNKT